MRRLFLALLHFYATTSVEPAHEPIHEGTKRIAFQLQPGTDTSALALIANASRIRDPRRIFRHAGRFEARHVAFGLDRWYLSLIHI